MNTITGLINPHFTYGLLVCLSHSQSYLTYALAVLDPEITYGGLKLDFAKDPELLADLERSKELLEKHYDKNYVVSLPCFKATDDSYTIYSLISDFTSQYSSINPEVVNKLEEYFKIKHKNFKKCDPLTVGQKTVPMFGCFSMIEVEKIKTIR